MNFRMYTIIFAVIFLAGLMASGGNLVANPSFEKQGKDGVPSGWLRHNLEPELASYGKSAARSGAFGVGILDKKGKNAGGWISEAFIRLEPGREYRLSGWIRTEKAWGDNVVGASLFALRNGRPAWQSSVFTPAVNGDKPWTYVELYFTVPEKVAFAKVCALRRYAAPGVSWFDDLALEKCSPANGAVPTAKSVPRMDWSRATDAERIVPGVSVREREIPASAWTKLEPSGGELSIRNGALVIAETALPGVGWLSPAFAVEPDRIYGLEATVEILRAWHVRPAAIQFGKDGEILEIRKGENWSEGRRMFLVRPVKGARELRFALTQSRSGGRSVFRQLMFHCFKERMNE